MPSWWIGTSNMVKKKMVRTYHGTIGDNQPDVSKRRGELTRQIHMYTLVI
jgi:hypothetical protein